jgi:hypothetical protein
MANLMLWRKKYFFRADCQNDQNQQKEKRTMDSEKKTMKTRADVGKEARNRACPTYRSILLDNGFIFNDVSNIKVEGYCLIFEAVLGDGKAVEIKTLMGTTHREKYKIPETNKALMVTLGEAISQFLEIEKRRINPVYINIVLDNGYIYNDVSNIQETDGWTTFEYVTGEKVVEVETTRKIIYRIRYL